MLWRGTSCPSCAFGPVSRQRDCTSSRIFGDPLGEMLGAGSGASGSLHRLSNDQLGTISGEHLRKSFIGVISKLRLAPANRSHVDF